MSLGKEHATESVVRRDPRTGRTVRQVTGASAIHHHPFFYIPAYDHRGRLYLVSHRSGTPQAYYEDGPGGPLVQITDRPNLNEWSCHPVPSGEYLYYTAGSEAWRTNLKTFKEEQIGHFGDVPMRATGDVGAAMGTTSLSADERWWCVYVKTEAISRLHVLDTTTGVDEVIVERDFIAHPQFHPDDPTLLRYAGPHTERLWVVRRDGSDHRLVYERDAEAREWIVHETWRPGTQEIIASNWPHGVIAVDAATGKHRWVTRARAWHPMVDRTGRQIVADTNWPDSGLILFDARGDDQPIETLCYPEATCVGDHWRTDHCPYDDGPVAVYAPQHTHPHPSFSPQGDRVVYTSDSSGIAQVYEVKLDG